MLTPTTFRPGRLGIAPLAAALAAAALLAATVGCRSTAGATPSRSAGPAWVEQEVTFQAGDVTIHGTYRHPAAGKARVPAALLIAGSGPTDRNGDDPTLPHMDTLRTLAGWLSDDGVASLRYDKLFSGATGAGPYAGRPGDVGLGVYEQEAAAALAYLAAQAEVDTSRLSVFGHSEGALYALLLRDGQAGRVPAIHALGLLEPLSLRYLDLLSNQIQAQLTSQLGTGAITAQQADPRCVPPWPER